MGRRTAPEAVAMLASSGAVAVAAEAAPGGTTAVTGVATGMASSGIGESPPTGTSAVANESVQTGVIATETTFEGGGRHLAGDHQLEGTSGTCGNRETQESLLSVSMLTGLVVARVTDRFQPDHRLRIHRSDNHTVAAMLAAVVEDEVVETGIVAVGDLSTTTATDTDPTLGRVRKKVASGSGTKGTEIETATLASSTLTAALATLEILVTSGILSVTERRDPSLTARHTSHLPSAAGKPPPTGPRALKEERPISQGGTPAAAEARQPPTGPSKPAYPEGSPPIPSGPRGLRTPGPSSKQWVNPSLKTRPSDVQQPSRSNSFAQPRPQGHAIDALGIEHPDDSQRPQSSDAKAGSRSFQDNQREDSLPARRRSAGSPTDRGFSFSGRNGNADEGDTKMEDAPRPVTRELSPGEIDPEAPDEQTQSKSKPRKRPVLHVEHVHASFSKPQAKPVVAEPSESSDDDDDENFGDELDNSMAEVEEKLKRLEGLEETLSMQPVVRHAILSIEAIIRVLDDSHSLQDLVGPLPGVTTSHKQETSTSAEPKRKERKPSINGEDQEMKETSVSKAEAKVEAPPNGLPMPPSVEQAAEKADSGPSQAGGEVMQPTNDEDTVMQDANEDARPAPLSLPNNERTDLLSVPDKALAFGNETDLLSQGASKQGSSAPSPAEDDDDEDTDIEDIDLQSIQIVREHMETPPIDSLPSFDEKPWFEDATFMKTLDAAHPGLDTFILKGLKEEATLVAGIQAKQKEDYAIGYEQYLRFTLSDDQDAVKSRGKFTCVATVPDPVPVKPVSTAEPKTESTRRSRYASERDLERVLEESRRVEDEKAERRLRAEKEKYRTEKEAVIPFQYQTEEERQNEFYVDTSGYIAPEKIISAWDVLPPIVNFTDEETQLFEKAYLEFPKQWGRISERIPERSFGTNIQFYYIKKDELNLKDKLKRRPRQRKRGGRGKQRSSALVSELGNRENEGDENAETGENGERRRPRRAAAPTFNSEATPATDDGVTPAGTPGRRAGGSRAEGREDKPERKPRGRRAAKDKEPKPPRGTQTLAAAPASGKGNRSRSGSRVQSTDWMAQQPQPDLGRGIATFEMPQAAPPIVPVVVPPPPQARPPLMNVEAPVPQVPGVVFDGMAPPLRPEPPLQQQQPPVTTLDLSQGASGDRKPMVQASSYWSVPEANDFPHLVRSFGTDWVAIAGHMKTKTAVMVKNYYARQKGNNKDLELFAQEADAKKARGEPRPQPPTPSTTGPKKRTEGSGNRPLAAADAMMEDVPLTKVEHVQTAQSMTGRFNVPIAAQPQPPQPPFVPVTHGQPVPGALSGLPAGSLGHGQPVAQTMSPRDRPLRPPYTFEREREGGLVQQPGRRTPLGQKSSHHGASLSESHSRHPLPPSMVDSQMDRQRMEPKPPKDSSRQPLRVKQEPDVMSHAEAFVGAGQQNGRIPLSRGEPLSLGRPPDGPRAVAPAPQAPYAALQQQSGRGLLGETMPPSSQPSRALSELARPMSRASAGSDPYGTPPGRAPSGSATPALSRAPEPRKTSSLMALLNDDPPPPKRVAEVPSAMRPSPTPPPQSRPPPPAAPSQLRRDGPMPETQAYYGRNPPAAPSAMPSLKPYTASPQAQSIAAPRHMGPMDGPGERDYYGGRPSQYGGAHQPPPAGSPPAGHPYQPPPGQPQYSQSPYGYGGPGQHPPAGSPPGQYSGLSSGPRGHEAPPTSRGEPSWATSHQQAQSMQQQQQQQSQQQQQQLQQHPSWAQQPPKTSQPQQPAQSAWAAQHAASAPKPPPPSSSVPPQPSWANTPPAPRGHNPMALRDVRDVYTPGGSRGMQPPPPNSQQQQQQQQQQQPSPYNTPTSSSRGGPPEPPPQQQQQNPYPRYSNTPGPGPVGGGGGRDPRDGMAPQQRSYTPNPYDSRGYPAPPPQQGQDMREAQMREQQAREQQQQQQQHGQHGQHGQQHSQQQLLLQQQLRPAQDGRHVYERERYGR
ncbi:hypothetical protein Micbo1qcDRAFT_198153 [Microdochium bolleyi]|uniref:Myb-like domain-containing protein n=1 Tax=Microdochium bolleyi TaxID=196109 RepID=A0A136IP14_9PEZI|nr:hypothetical protein Micbo1qcDRAFT_198153 [Microdochium bolleyi]